MTCQLHAASTVIAAMTSLVRLMYVFLECFCSKWLTQSPYQIIPQWCLAWKVARLTLASLASCAMNKELSIVLTTSCQFLSDQCHHPDVIT